MNYELAKKLKDAGFPQNLKGKTDLYCQSGRHPDSHGWPKTGNPCEVYAIPTLSELIEACGDRFGSLHSCLNAEKKVCGWLATGIGKPYPGCEGIDPDIAVANLWLALHG